MGKSFPLMRRPGPCTLHSCGSRETREGEGAWRKRGDYARSREKAKLINHTPRGALLWPHHFTQKPVRSDGGPWAGGLSCD